MSKNNELLIQNWLSREVRNGLSLGGGDRCSAYAFKQRRFCNEAKLRIAEDYLANPDKYVKKLMRRINGKSKCIITYQYNSDGRALEMLHRSVVANILKRYEFAANSYAFQCGKDIKDCLEQHLGSSRFLKTDIHKYFESITYGSLRKKIKNGKMLPASNQTIILKACFYEGRLPIGFVSSPILSDIYLHDFDLQMMEQQNGLIYTRYADDIIFSVRNEDQIDLDKFKISFEESMKKEGLELNSKKTYARTLKLTGDAIHLLGINLVRKDNQENRMTISDKYIRDTSKEIAALLSDSDDTINQRAMEVKGKISFIRYFSESSFKKLERMFQAHTKLDISLSNANIDSMIAMNCDYSR